MFDFTDNSNIGKIYDGFVLISIDELQDYNAKGIFLRHKKTGLEIYHITKKDKENLFAFAFRTIAKDSKGAAHILEHSALCGSEKFPLKEPFSTLLSASLNTFLNAITYPDKTVYPAASVAQSDYFNMMDVYADAVFFPTLSQTAFIQEGHRLELDEKNNLSVQGVVYNEMKGNYSSFRQVAFSNLISAMFPESYAAFDSAGDPLEIPSLTYRDFLDFHQKFYAPDNCLLFLYGDIPTQTQLDFLNEKFMPRIEKKYGCKEDFPNFDCKTPIVKKEIKDLQKIELRKKNAEIRTFAPEADATGNFVAINWYTGKSTAENKFLNEVLSGNDSSPIPLALNKSKFGDSPLIGTFGQYPETFFAVGLNSVKTKNEKKVFKLIEETIQKITENGVSQKDVDSAIMGVDFNLREENRYFGPASIQIMEKTLKSWTIGNSCAANLSPISDFEKLKKQIKDDENFVKNLIKKYFAKENVIVKFTCEPSPKFLRERQIAEKKLIQNLEKNLDKTQLRKNLEALHEYQQRIETPEETACIPSTKLSALDKKIETPESTLEFAPGGDGNEIPIFVSKENTKGIFYFETLFPFDNLEPSELQYVPFLSEVITNLGWSGKKWDECVAQASCVMGDVWGKITCGRATDAPESKAFLEKYKKYNFIGRYWIGLSVKALTSRAKESLKLLSQIITTMDFKDEQRFSKLVKELVAEKKSEIVNESREYATRRIKADLNEYRALMEIMYGISQLKTVKKYSKTKPKTILKIFKNIYEKCLESGGILHVVADEKSLQEITPLIRDFAKTAKIKKLQPPKKYSYEDLKPYVAQNEILSQKNKIQIFPMKTQTGFSSCVTTASPFMTKQSAAETVLASWLETHSLWDKIRTTGGAYGANAWNDSQEESFVMTTYRDPAPQKSLQVFQEILKETSQTKIPAEDIEKTIVSCYGNAIIPLTPKERGAKSFEEMLYATLPQLRQKRLENIMEVTNDDVQKAAENLYKNSQEKFQKAIFCDKKLAKSLKESGNFIKNPL